MKIIFFKQLYPSKSDIIAFVSGLLVIVAVILSTSLTVIDYNNKRIIEISIIITILFFSTFIPAKYTKKNTKLKLPYLVLFFFGIISSFLANSLRHSIIELITFLGLSIAVLQLSPAWKIKPFCILAALSLIIGIGITEVVFFTSYLAYIVSSNNFSIHEFFPAFANVRFFNQYQIWTMPYITFMLLQKHTILKQYNTLLWSIGVAWWLIFFSTGSRGAVVAELSAIAIAWFFFRKEIKDFTIL